MPSLQQLGWEAFADAFEKRRRAEDVAVFGVRNTKGVFVHVDLVDGSSEQMQLLEVDLDGRELIGRIPRGRGLTVPLERVKAVWERRRLSGRALSIWFATLVSIATLGTVVAGGRGLVGGALLGAIAGIGVTIVFDESKALYKWVPLYDSSKHR